MNTQNIDVLVVGGGPAGCSAATIVARNRWKTLLVDGALEEGYVGGLGTVSYFPGIAESIAGVELVKRFRRQAELVGAQFKNARAEKVDVEGEHPQVVVGGESVAARAVLLATGAARRTNYLHGEKEFMGRGVSHDAISDGPIFSHRRVAVVGKGQAAAEEALALTRFASHVVFVIPSSKLDADESVQKRVRENKKIEPLFSASLKKINGTDHVNSITAFVSGKEKDIEVNGVFSYVHDYQPMNDYLGTSVETAGNGAVKVGDDFSTSAAGVFACGDILCARPQLPAISAAQGVLAGMSIDRFLVGS